MEIMIIFASEKVYSSLCFKAFEVFCNASIELISTVERRL